MSGWSGPGIILGFFTPRDSSEVSLQTLETWLDREYVPALRDIVGLKGAWLYTAANQKCDKQYVLVCKVLELSSIQPGKFHDLGKGSMLSHSQKPAGDHIKIDLRMYSFVQLYETSKHDKDFAPTIMLAMIEPAQGGEADLDAWCREEHNQQMSKQPGWWRTTRCSLLDQHASDDQESTKLTFLAIHEFGDGHQLGTEVRALEPMLDWTKKVMSAAMAIDAAIYLKQRDLGERLGHFIW